MEYLLDNIYAANAIAFLLAGICWARMSATDTLIKLAMYVFAGLNFALALKVAGLIVKFGGLE